MPPRHIAMFTVPVPGHINPSLEIIRELAARGHRVTYGIPDEFVPTIKSLGAEPVVYSSTFKESQEPQDELGGAELFLDEAIHVLPQIAAAYEHDRPDLILHDFGSWAGAVLAHRWGLPALQISSTFVPWRGYEEFVAPVLEDRRKDPRGRAYYERFGQWLAADGIDADPDRWLLSPQRSIVPIPKALQPHADDVDDDVYTFVGPCLGARPHQDPWQRPAKAEKVLLISLGSAYNNEPEFYRECFAAFGDLEGWHVVLNTGRALDASVLGPPPENFELHSWLPQLAILQQADMFITHAGMGGTMEGLWCGVPMLAVPQAYDQFTNAHSITRLGVGRQLASTRTAAGTLRRAVLDLAADPQVAAASARLRDELRASGGTPRAVEIIEGYLPR